ncbi:hypothetical protein FKM82_001320 [Ascaphus truei]
MAAGSGGREECPPIPYRVHGEHFYRPGKSGTVSLQRWRHEGFKDPQAGRFPGLLVAAPRRAARHRRVVTRHRERAPPARASRAPRGSPGVPRCGGRRQGVPGDPADPAAGGRAPRSEGALPLLRRAPVTLRRAPGYCCGRERANARINSAAAVSPLENASTTHH